MHAFISVLLASVLAAASAIQAPSPLETMRRRVDDYATLHRLLEGPLPPEQVTSDARRLTAIRLALASAIRRARPDARQGDIVSAEAAAYLRATVAAALREGHVDDMEAIVEDENSVHVAARVNGEFPAGRSVALMPPCLLAALPALPPELRYAFVGRDLILWDVHAGLIVDFVPEAIPEKKG